VQKLHHELQVNLSIVTS